MEKAGGLFKELNLTQEQAQKAVDFYATISQEAANAPFEFYQEMRTDWRKTIAADPVLGDGKEGFKPEVGAAIARAIDMLPKEDAAAFREALALTGAGDNPAYAKGFYALAKMLGEGTSVPGMGPSPAGQVPPGKQSSSAAAAIWPGLPSSSR